MREAAWGRASWGDVCLNLGALLPGSVPVIVNHDLSANAVDAVFTDGMAPSFLASYREYYGALNPWLDFWASEPANKVSLSERDCPSAAFRETEFYHDWLAPQGNMNAAAGVRFDVNDQNVVLMAWHYGVARADTYDRVAGQVLEGLKSAIGDAARGAAELREGLESSQRLGSLMESIDGAALLVERNRHIREANTEAAAAFRRGEVLSAAAGEVLVLRDAAAQRWLEEAVVRLVDGLPIAATTMAFSLGESVFSVSVTRAPDHAETGFGLLLLPRPRVLVVVKPLTGAPVRIDETALKITYGLSGAETRLCELLVNGRSLAEAAEILHVSEGTVRQRVKVIFHKTGTHRQGELVAVLARFGRGGWPADDVGGR